MKSVFRLHPNKAEDGVSEGKPGCQRGKDGNDVPFCYETEEQSHVDIVSRPLSAVPARPASSAAWPRFKTTFAAVGGSIAHRPARLLDRIVTVTVDCRLRLSTVECRLRLSTATVDPRLPTADCQSATRCRPLCR